MKMKKLLSRFDQMAHTHTIFKRSQNVDRSENKIEKYKDNIVICAAEIADKENKPS